MGMGCGSRCLKFSLFAFNFIFFIGGALCVMIGVWLILDQYSIDKIAKAAEESAKRNGDDLNLRELADKPKAVREVGVIFAVGGGVVLLVAFLGCCGAMKEWRPLLVLYAAALMVILTIEIVAASYAAINRNKVDIGMKKLLRASLTLYNGTESMETKKDGSNAMKIAWDTVMEERKCCGIESNDREFIHTPWFKLTAKHSRRSRFPPACCPNDPNRQRPYDTCPASARYTQGCYRVIVTALSSAFSIVVWSVSAIAIFQLLYLVIAFATNFTGAQHASGHHSMRFQVVGIIFAFSLCRAIGEFTEYY